MTSVARPAVAALRDLLRSHPMFAPIVDDTASPTQRQMDEHDTVQRQLRADGLADWLIAHGISVGAALEADSPRLSVPVICPNCTHVFPVGAVLEAPPSDDALHDALHQENERILEGVCSALDLDPNCGDEGVEDGAVTWIVAAIRKKYECPPEPRDAIFGAIAALDDGALEVMRGELAQPSGAAFHRDTLRRYLTHGVRGEVGPLPPEPSEAAIAAALNVSPERFRGVQPYGGVMEPMLAPEQIAVMLRAAYSVDFGVCGVVPAPPPEAPIYVYSSHSERLLYFPDLEKYDPLVIGPSASIELRWIRHSPQAP